jgi:hypothetical protein
MDFQPRKRRINIRDQQPLYAGNILLDGGWSFEDMIQSLNERVFFWPGTAYGPIEHGRRHYQRYADESPIIIRASTSEMYAANPDSTPFFTDMILVLRDAHTGKGAHEGQIPFCPPPL